jgi:ketosteroid isomerase-like protein
MKIKHMLAVVIATVLCCLNSIARADDDADRAALRMIRTNYEDAANSGDLSKFKNDLTDQVTGVMVTGEPVTGYDGLVSYWKGIQDLIGPGGSYHVTVNTDKTDLFGDISVSRGTTDESVRLANGKELDFNSYWTAVCHKENGEWKVFRMQATLNPIHNVFVSLQLGKAKLIYGIGGFVVGVVLVLLLQFFRSKPKGQYSPVHKTPNTVA